MAEYDPIYCREKVWDGNRSKHFQCSRKAVKDGYCKQHHPDSVKARQEQSEKEYEEKRKNSTWYLLKVANERIEELESELANAKRGASKE